MQRINQLKSLWEFSTDSKSVSGNIGAFIALTHHEERRNRRTVASIGVELKAKFRRSILEVFGVVGASCLEDGGAFISNATT